MERTEYETFRETYFHIPLEKYLWLIPQWPDKPLSIANLEEYPNFPRTEHLLDGFIIALGLTIFRFFLDKWILIPLGRIAMKHECYKSPLLKEYDTDKKFQLLNEEIQANNFLPNSKEKKLLKQQTNLSLDEINAFFRFHRQFTNESKNLIKFQEVAYKSIVHIFLMFYGFYFVIYEQPWIWENPSCWTKYPFMPVYQSIYWYYMIEFGSYIHEFFYFFAEIKRKDYWEMLIHHIATLFLISVSYIVNFMPIGAIIMIIHDMVDFLLEFAKLFNYMKESRPWAATIADNLFNLFAVVFFLTRCVMYPAIPIKNLIESRDTIMPSTGVYDILLTFCLILQVLHILWLYMIVRMAIDKINGKGTKDTRSDDDLPLNDNDDLDKSASDDKKDR